MINTSVLPKAYTPEQVAEMLQLSKNTVYQLISRGEIVAKKLEKCIEFPETLFHFFSQDLMRISIRRSKKI